MAAADKSTPVSRLHEAMREAAIRAAEDLAQKDPRNADVYRRNAMILIAKLH